MINGLAKVKQNPYLAGFVLLYVLPPVGMAWFLYFAVRDWRHHLKDRHALPVDVISILLALMAAASIGSALVNRQMFDLLSTLILLGYLSIYLFWLRHPEHLQIREFAWITIWGGVYIVLSDYFLNFIPYKSAAGQFFSLLTGHFLFGYRGLPRLYGPAFNPNYACYLLILAVAFLSVELLRAIRLRNRQLIILSLVIIPIVDLGIYETGSRAGFAIMVLIHLLFMFKLNWKLFIPTLAVTVIGTPFLYQWMPRSDDTESSMAKRIEIWGNSWNLFKENSLFGTTTLGFGRDYKAMYGEMIPHAHDLFLTVLTTSGIICGLFFIIATVICAGQLIRAQIIAPKTNYSAMLFLFSLPTIILYGLLDFTLSSPQVTIIVLVLLSYWIRYAAHMNRFAHSRRAMRNFLAARTLITKRHPDKPAALQPFKGVSGK